MMHDVMVVHVYADVGQYIDGYCKGKLTKKLGLNCDFGYKSCVFSINLGITVSSRQYMGYNDR